MNYVETLKEADAAYYNKETSIFTDAEYDQLKRKAKAQFPNDPYFKTVGAPVSDNTPWTKEKHSIVMGSIENIQTESKETWVEDTIQGAINWWKKLGSPAVLIEPKLDGLSLNLEYKNYRLVKAILRGDGKEGENILRNVTNFGNIRVSVPDYGVITNIHGEVLCNKTALKEINEKLISEGETPYAGCRSAAAGIARRFDGRFSEYLNFIPFDIIRENYKAHDTDFISLEEHRIRTKSQVVTAWICMTEEDIRNAYLSMLHGREDLPYEVDGVVIKVNSFGLRNDDSALPNWVRAMKFPPEEKLFTVDAITWYVGKTGKLTPVMTNNKGVQFSSKVIREVTLHNLNYFKDHAICKGDEISVTISMDVIPKIDKVINRNGGDKFAAPIFCPSCTGELKEEGAYLMCTNHLTCPGILKAKINAFITDVGIENIGPDTVDKLFSLNLITTPADLFNLGTAGFLKLEGYAIPMAVKSYEAIQARKKLSLATFISALSIPGIGESFIEKAGLKTLDECFHVKPETLASKEGIGIKTATKFLEGMLNNTQLISEFIINGVQIIEKEIIQVEANILAGKTFCFTGDVKEINPDTQSPFTREECQALVTRFGGENKSGVSKKLDYLVLADMSSLSTKARKAKDYGTKLISSFEFLNMVKAI